MSPSSNSPTSTFQLLSADDLLLLRRLRHASPHEILFGIFIFVIFFTSGIMSLVLSFDSSINRKLPGLILLPLFSVACLGLSYFIGRQFTTLPRSWFHIKRAMAGRIPKQIVTGRLQSIQPGTKPGMLYMLETKQIEVALPYWNKNLFDSDKGLAPQTAQARTGGLITLHLLPLLPGQQPLLLRVDYHDHPPAQLRTEPMTEKDREPIREGNAFKAIMALFIAGIFVIAGLFSPPFLLAAAIVAIIGFIPAPTSRTIEKAVCKHILNGIVDEVLRFSILVGAENPEHAIRYNYRIGGVLYPITSEQILAEPGQRLTVEYLDNGKRGLVHLSFRAEDTPHSGD